MHAFESGTTIRTTLAILSAHSCRLIQHPTAAGKVHGTFIGSADHVFLPVAERTVDPTDELPNVIGNVPQLE